jgi:hypothetical protein
MVFIRCQNVVYRGSANSGAVKNLVPLLLLDKLIQLISARAVTVAALTFLCNLDSARLLLASANMVVCERCIRAIFWTLVYCVVVNAVFRKTETIMERGWQKIEENTSRSKQRLRVKGLAQNKHVKPQGAERSPNPTLFLRGLVACRLAVFLTWCTARCCFSFGQFLSTGLTIHLFLYIFPSAHDVKCQLITVLYCHIFNVSRDPYLFGGSLWTRQCTEEANSKTNGLSGERR